MGDDRAALHEAGPGSWPLTGAQEGVWLAQALAPGSPAYNTADAIELTGALDAEALAGHIRTVIDAAQALHVVVEDGSGGPVQRAVGDRDWPLPIHDLRGSADPRGAAERIMHRDLDSPVDLAAGPLFRTELMRTGDERWTWYLRIHHFATDAYATALIVRRVAALAGGGDRVDLGGLSSLVDADAAYRAGDQHAADRAFWAERLAAHEAPVRLSDVLHGTGAAAGSGDEGFTRPHRATHVIDGPAWAAVGRAAAAAGASWPELVMAAITANLQSLTGQRRQTLAMPVLARSGAIRKTPGIAVNIVPLSVDVDPAAPLATLVGQIRDELRAVRPHQGLRFEEAARLLPTGTLLFGPQINVKPYVSAFAIAGVNARIRNLSTGPVDDLSLIATELPGGALELTLDASAARYDAAATETQLERLVTTLVGAATRGATARPVAELPTITAREREHVVDVLNATHHHLERTTITAQLLAQIARTPDLPAVSDDRETITYTELGKRASALARSLAAGGAGPNAIVGIDVPRSVDLSVAIIGTLLAGAAYLPLDPELPQDRRAYVLGDAAPTTVLDAAAVRAALAASPAATTNTSSTNFGPAGRLPLPAPAPAPADAAYVIYTSGSTGRPKGVVTEHAALVNRLAWMQHALPIGPGDAILQKTPCGFDVSVWELIWPLLHGAKLVMAKPGGHRDPAYLAAAIQREGITVAHFVPSMLDLFLDEPAAGDCTSLRHVVCSGEALPEATARRALERLPAPLHNLYGPTEAAIDVTSWSCSLADPPGPVPIGRPIWNTRTYVLDESLRPLPVGVQGELWLAGANLAREYLGRPDLTAERFVADPFHGGRMYRTGDLARWRPDGALDYLGRNDDQVKLRGLRIELGEIEATLARHPAVSRAAASVDRGGPSPRIVAHVVLHAEAIADDVIAHAAAELPEYMVPVAIGFVDDLPLSPNGKLDRRRLPAISDDRGGLPGDHEPSRAPASPREQQLCDLFAAALGVPSVSAGQNLFDLGGDSLLAAGLAGRIRAALGVPLTLGALFASPTPAALAARIDDGTELDALEPLLTLRAGGDAAPLFCFHPAGGIAWCYAGLTRTVQDRPIFAVQAPGVLGDAMPATLTALAAAYADLVESAHPAGPCHLLGWSIGGVLAQAVSVELAARGRETGVLALLDAYPGEQWAAQPHPTPEEMLVALLHMGGLDEHALAGATPTPERVLEALAADGSALASLGPLTFGRVAQTVGDCSRLMREHRTAPSSGQLLFFEAAAPRREDWLDASAWAGHTGAGVVTHPVDCTHPEMPRRGPLDEIGTLVAEALARFDAGADAGTQIDAAYDPIDDQSRSITWTGASPSTATEPA